MKRNNLAPDIELRRNPIVWAGGPARRQSMTSHAVVSSWSDDEIEVMASSDPDHPALDDAFWDRAEAGPVEERSNERIEHADLQRLSTLAIRTLDELSRRLADRPTGLNRTRLKLVALAQGAAQHAVEGSGGIKDFDLWAFFEAGGVAPFPHRPTWSVDFGRSRFGVNPDDRASGYQGRRVDIMGRSISFERGENESSAVQRWLRSGTDSARHLAARPLIVIYPLAILGEVIRPDR